MLKPRILLDLDGVLVDFDHRAISLHRPDLAVSPIRYKEFQDSRRGVWDLCPSLGLSLSEFWEPINEMGAEFWLGIQLLPWAESLLQEIQNITDDWFIVSSPGFHPSAYDGKVRWLKKQFGSRFDRFFLTSHKHALAKPGVLLIDDHRDNVHAFLKERGEAVLFPAYGNKNHSDASDPLPWTLNALREICSA